jgi:hypothetical protein
MTAGIERHPAAKANGEGDADRTDDGMAKETRS